MWVGRFVDGRDLLYDESTDEFSVGEAVVSITQLREYAAFDQLWFGTPALRDWAASSFGVDATVLPPSETTAPAPQPHIAPAPSGASAMVCPHCQTVGTVRTRQVKQKKGVSGGKATAAVLTGGISVLATGLSRKERVTEARCSRCGNRWHF